MPIEVLDGESPYYSLHKMHPDYNFLRVFGCACYPWLKPYISNKLQARSKRCIFIGYASTAKGYCCYDIASRKVYLSRHVLFRENDFPFSSTESKATGAPFPPILGLDPSLASHSSRSASSQTWLSNSSNSQSSSSNNYSSCQPLDLVLACTPSEQHSLSNPLNHVPHSLTNSPMSSPFYRNIRSTPQDPTTVHSPSSPDNPINSHSPDHLPNDPNPNSSQTLEVSSLDPGL